MLNIAIIDDERKELELLTEYSERCAKENNLDVDVRVFDNSLEFLNEYKPVYDLLLLDIEMPNLNGMDLAKMIRRTDPYVSIIFVTNMAQYAINGYCVDASDFIVKPVIYADYVMKVGRIMRRISQKDVAKITVKSDGSEIRIAIGDIRYVEVRTHTLIYHTVNGDLAVRGTLKNVEALLCEKGFAKCNNYCLINLRYVTGVQNFSVFITDKKTGIPQEISISHPRKKEFLGVLADFWRDNT